MISIDGISKGDYLWFVDPKIPNKDIRLVEFSRFIESPTGDFFAMSNIVSEETYMGLEVGITRPLEQSSNLFNLFNSEIEARIYLAVIRENMLSENFSAYLCFDLEQHYTDYAKYIEKYPEIILKFI